MEYEIYNLTDNPIESKNLANKKYENPESKKIMYEDIIGKFKIPYQNIFKLPTPFQNPNHYRPLPKKQYCILIFNHKYSLNICQTFNFHNLIQSSNIIFHFF